MELHEFPVFEHLDEAQVADFCAACNRTQHVTGEELITRGEIGGTFFFLLEGEVEVYLPETRGRHVLCTVTAPAVLGEMEFLTGKPRTASVCALSDVTLLGISFEVLRGRVTNGDPGTLQLFVVLSEILARRLTRTTEMLAELEASVPRAQRRELQDFRSRLLSDWSF
jgi:CRP-like cAMP-binding protein